MLAVAYGAATFVAWASSDVPEIAAECLCLAALVAYVLAQPAEERGRLFWIVVFPIPAFVLLHERFGVRHWVAYGPAALSLVMAIWAGGAGRRA
ncbi:MAG: hypothetical protein M3340_08565 [Actinomycetota bacterium]|nr:hypothetical protein [Actinomycetota bacterium]